MEKLLGKDAYRAAANQTHKKLAQLKKVLTVIYKHDRTKQKNVEYHRRKYVTKK